MIKRHNYTLSEIESMMSWEKDIHVGLIIQDLKKQEELAKRNNG
jgi:hypothetical protein